MDEMSKLKEDMVMEMALKKQDEFLDAAQKRTLDKILENSENQAKTIEKLKREIANMKKNNPEKKSLEFCCVECNTIHDSQQCPACGSKLKRIYEESTVK